MELKLNRNLDNNIPTKSTKNVIKSEKAYPVCFAVFSMLFSASKRCFERFISQHPSPRASLYYVNGKVGNFKSNFNDIWPVI